MFGHPKDGLRRKVLWQNVPFQHFQSLDVNPHNVCHFSGRKQMNAAQRTDVLTKAIKSFHGRHSANLPWAECVGRVFKIQSFIT